jgi:hypothetical protein
MIELRNSLSQLLMLSEIKRNISSERKKNENQSKIAKQLKIRIFPFDNNHEEYMKIM